MDKMIKKIIFIPNFTKKKTYNKNKIWLADEVLNLGIIKFILFLKRIF